MINSKNDISGHGSKHVAGRHAARSEARKMEEPTEFADHLKAAASMTVVKESILVPELENEATREVVFDLGEQTIPAAVSFSSHQDQTELCVAQMANASTRVIGPAAMELVPIESAVLDPDINETRFQPVLPFHKKQAGFYGLAKEFETDIPEVKLPVVLTEVHLPLGGKVEPLHEDLVAALAVQRFDFTAQPVRGRQAISSNQIEPGFPASMPHHAVLAQVHTAEKSGATQDPRAALRVIELPAASVQSSIPPGESTDRPSTIREAMPAKTPPLLFHGRDRSAQPNGVVSNLTNVPGQHDQNSRGDGKPGGTLADEEHFNEPIEAAPLRSDSMRPDVEVRVLQPGSPSLQDSPARQIVDMAVRALPAESLNAESATIKTIGFTLRPEQLGEVLVTLRLRGKVLELKIETQTAGAALNIEHDRTLLGQLLHGIGFETTESNILITVRNQPPTSLFTDQPPFATPQHHWEPGANSSGQPRQGAPGQQTAPQAAASRNGRPDDETQAAHLLHFNRSRGIYV